jgi:transcriptional antiterminator
MFKPRYLYKNGRVEETRQTGGTRISWSEDMISVVKRYFPNTNTAEVAEMISVSERTLRRKAKELNLTKDREFIRSCQSRGGFSSVVKINSKRWRKKEEQLSKKQENEL